LPFAVRLDESIKIPSLSPLHDEVVVLFISEGTVETSDEWRLGLFEDSLLQC